MATATDNSDLLILSDDDTKTDEMVTEETNLNEEISPSTEELISFDDEPIMLTEETKEEVVDLNQDDTTNTLDFGVDLDLTKETKEEIKDEVKLDVKEEDSFDFGDLGADVSTDSTPEVKEETLNMEEPMFGGDDLGLASTSGVGTMEDILDKAITDLEARSETISGNKANKEESIAELKAQIADLELKVKTANEEVSELNSEQEMITKNSKSLERMKKTNVATEVKTETSRKVHNTKRKQAA